MRLRTLLIAACATLGVVQSAAADPPVVRSVEIRGEGNRAEVAITGAWQVPTYAVRARDGGRTVVIDVTGAQLPRSGVRTVGQTNLVEETTAATTARGVRIEVGLTRPVTYRARADDGRIVVSFGPPGPADAPSSASGPAAVRDVHVERRDGRERVVVQLTRPAEFRVMSDDDASGPARLTVEGAHLAPDAPRSLQVNDHGVVHGVRLVHSPDGIVVEVDRSPGASGPAVREGDRIVWLIAPAPERSSAPRPRTIARERPIHFTDGETDTSEAAAFLSDVPLQVRAARGARRYSGRRVDLDFKDADIHNILRLLANVGGVNVVTSDDVQGSVTITMHNVPWDQALDVILQAKSLGMVRRGNLIRVAPLTTLEKEREAAIARAKQRQQLAPLETRLIPVSYAQASDLQPRVQELLSPRGTVSVDTRTNTLIVRDLAENLDDVEELVRTLDTQTPQVLVEARIVEATSEYSRDVGIQWGGDVTVGTATGNPTGLAFPSNIGVAGGNYDNNTPTEGLSPFQGSVDPSNFAVNLPAITGTRQGGALGLTFGSIGGNFNLSVRLSAAEANGVVHIISAPRVLTLDNHEAHIDQGTLIPYSQVSAQGVQTAFQEAKLELRVRPHVTSDGQVAMHVKVTRDVPDFTRTSSRGDPTILKREAETDLLIADGNTAVIGGIYTRNTGRNLDQVPFFGDIPILGVLFQRRRVNDQRNELLIFLTPRIVNRAAALGPGAEQGQQGGDQLQSAQ